jgi:hypothetical protein
MDTNRVERIGLPDGEWWDIKAVVTRGMRKQFDKAALAIAGDLKLDPDAPDPDALMNQALENPMGMNLAAIDDEYLMVGTMATSFGLKVPPTVDELDDLPDTWTGPVIARMTELYKEDVELGKEEPSKPPPSPQKMEQGSVKS